jgi:Rhomboid-like protein
MVAAWHFVISAPLTYSWLAALLVTTLTRRYLLTKHESDTVVVDGSTNIHHLLRDPLEVLIGQLAVDRRPALASAFEASIGSGEAQVRVSPSEIPRGGYLTGVSNESLRSPAN